MRAGSVAGLLVPSSFPFPCPFPFDLLPSLPESSPRPCGRYVAASKKVLRTDDDEVRSSAGLTGQPGTSCHCGLKEPESEGWYQSGVRFQKRLYRSFRFLGCRFTPIPPSSSPEPDFCSAPHKNHPHFCASLQLNSSLASRFKSQSPSSCLLARR
ncbi:hypothetical protein CROQUDRAFT_93151 [Cronartium quercuum f. sp. fusiforme G11]|uniref:Uncharacterized protein n=1 Tax=Cronartium quercuum f. sp. fusiforme G11 TaxID=708437 RepID=A0A9P6NI89_9BASI|nr:hypothetical protein CROQUDRAFT_93151 [Cronartium quercuum f. sp. fusiforme G11]